MNIALRCYFDNKLNPQNDNVIQYNENLVFVFDTETTIDQYQNLRFGSYSIWENDKLDKFGLFYDNNPDNNDVKTLSNSLKEKALLSFLDML